MIRDYLRSSDFEADKILSLFALAARIKADTHNRKHLDILRGYSTAMIFQKPSLRTRMTFDIGMAQLGGSAIYLGPAEISLGVRESAHDIAKNLERWCDLIVARVYAQDDIEQLAESSVVPVINALSNDDHPCQAMADYFTLYERGFTGPNLTIAYVGDGNNTCTAVATVGAILGADVRVAAPAGYALPAKYAAAVAELAAKSGGRVLFTEDPTAAVTGADAVYTDTWASMHNENESEVRRPAFKPFQVNAQLMAKAKPGAVAMHCLPAHRNEEITDEVMDGPQSVVFDQAENRLHIQKVIMLECLGVADKV